MLLAITAFAQKQMVVDANAQMRTVSGSFTHIKVRGGIDLYLSQADQQSIAVSASDDKYRDQIKTVVNGNTLEIYMDGENNWSRGNRKLKAYVSFRDLESLEASGASDVIIAGELKVKNLIVRVSGASDLKGEIHADKLDMRMSGASDVTVSGSANDVIIESSGASDFKGYDFTAATCDARASGASDVHITVTKEISARASGASSVSYKGSASLKESSSSGASDIQHKG
jgi:hypothetical protein